VYGNVQLCFALLHPLLKHYKVFTCSPLVIATVVYSIMYGSVTEIPCLGHQYRMQSSECKDFFPFLCSTAAEGHAEPLVHSMLGKGHCTVQVVTYFSDFTVSVTGS